MSVRAEIDRMAPVLPSASRGRRSTPLDHLLLAVGLVLLALGVLALAQPPDSSAALRRCGLPPIVGVVIKDDPETIGCRDASARQVTAAAAFVGVAMLPLLVRALRLRRARQMPGEMQPLPDSVWFPGRKPFVGRARNGLEIEVGGDRIRVHHPLLRMPAEVTLGDLAGATSTLTGDQDAPVLARDVRLLTLAQRRTDAPLLMVFRAPLHVNRFRFGAEQQLAISSKERRRGIDVDAIAVDVVGVGDVIAELARRNVEVTRDAQGLLIDVIGVAAPHEIDARVRDIARLRRRARLRLAAAVLLTATTVLIRVGLAVAPEEADMGESLPFPRFSTVAPNEELPGPPRLADAPGEAFIGSQGGGVDPATAEQVFLALYPLHTRAVFYKDERTLRTLAATSAADAEIARCELHCMTPPLTTSIGDYRLSAPPQRGFPAYFFASVRRLGALGQPVTELLVFDRQSAEEPWRIAIDVASDTSDPLLDEGTANVGASPPQLPGLPLEERVHAMAAIFDAAGSSQRWSLDPVQYDQSVFERALNIQRGVAEAAADGRKLTRRYRIPAESFVARASAGRGLVCSVMLLESRHVATRDAIAHFDVDDEWPTLPFNDYRTIEARSVDQVCFIVGADGLGYPIWTRPIDVEVRGERA